MAVVAAAWLAWSPGTRFGLVGAYGGWLYASVTCSTSGWCPSRSAAPLARRRRSASAGSTSTSARRGSPRTRVRRRPWSSGAAGGSPCGGRRVRRSARRRAGCSGPISRRRLVVGRARARRPAPGRAAVPTSASCWRSALAGALGAMRRAGWSAGRTSRPSSRRAARRRLPPGARRRSCVGCLRPSTCSPSPRSARCAPRPSVTGDWPRRARAARRPGAGRAGARRVVRRPGGRWLCRPHRGAVGRARSRLVTAPEVARAGATPTRRPSARAAGLVAVATLLTVAFGAVVPVPHRSGPAVAVAAILARGRAPGLVVDPDGRPVPRDRPRRRRPATPTRCWPVRRRLPPSWSSRSGEPIRSIVSPCRRWPGPIGRHPPPLRPTDRVGPRRLLRVPGALHARARRDRALAHRRVRGPGGRWRDGRRGRGGPMSAAPRRWRLAASRRSAADRAHRRGDRPGRRAFGALVAPARSPPGSPAACAGVAPRRSSASRPRAWSRRRCSAGSGLRCSRPWWSRHWSRPSSATTTATRSPRRGTPSAWPPVGDWRVRTAAAGLRQPAAPGRRHGGRPAAAVGLALTGARSGAPGARRCSRTGRRRGRSRPARRGLGGREAGWPSPR